MSRIAVLGAGAWGTALAATLHRAGRDVVLWGRDATVIAEIAQSRSNRGYLGDIALPDGLHATTDTGAAVADAESVLAVVPAQALRATLSAIADAIPPEIPIIACAKGLERETAKPMAEVVADMCPNNPPAALSGPSFATDVAAGLPTAVTLAADDIALAEELAQTLSTPHFRIYASDDLIGVEIGGALKNVLAIAAGAVRGRGLGKSAEAALIARGFAEMRRLAAALGARPETLMGLSGLGDLVLTCSSPQSRNFSFGMALGEGAAVPELLAEGRPLAEGAATAGVAEALARRHGISMPITEAVAAVLDERRLSVAAAIDTLLTRPLKREDS